MALISLMATIVLTGAVAPARAEDDAELTPQQQLERAVEQLTAEAQHLDELGEGRVSPVFRRPHPTMAGWEGEVAVLALQRMRRSFTGNAYRDTYIRWHLLWAAKQALREQLDRYLTLGEHELPPRVSEHMLELLNAMPESIERERRPETRYEPPEIRAEYNRVRNQIRGAARVRIGYPPFDRTYYGRAALPYIPANQRAEIERVIEEAEARMAELRPQFRAIVDTEARAYNNRISRMNSILRQYRGELIYTLIQTGDDDMFIRAIRAIDEQQRQGQWTAIDLLRYMYLASMDGYLLLFDDATLQRGARELRRIADRSMDYREYRFGDRPPPSYYEPAGRNFGDYAFHMVHLLEDPGALRWFHQQVALPDTPPEARRSDDFQFTSYNFTMDDVKAARDRAVRALLGPDARLTASDDIQNSRMDRLRGVSRNNRRHQELVHQHGNHALVAWALMANGENYQDPRLFRHINWVLSSDTPYTFDRGMRLQMLAQMPSERWRPWVRRDLHWLTNALGDKGNWPYRYTGGEYTGWGDHANGAYGVLGLWAAQQTGADIPLSVWQSVDEHWRKTQQTTPGDQPAGWAVGMFNVEDDQPADDDFRNAFYRRVTGPMTATGVSTLMLTERYLHGPERARVGQQNTSTELQKGIDWLDRHFTLDTGDDPSADWFYYMWTMQRVGEATGYRTFNGIDWFREVTAEMLNRQQPNGLWEDPTGRQGTLVSTSFALLYLANAYDPIGISKIRFDGDWNNRPHDLLNFVQYASDLYQQPTSWQIITLDQPVYQLMESPLLYIATDSRFRLADAEVDRLRQYIHAGGMLVLNPDRADAGLARSLQHLAEQLFPDLAFEDVPADHPIFRVHQRLRPNLRMRMIHNGVRPLIVQFIRDVGEDLQANRIGRSDAFAALSNLYLYSVSRNPRRTRLETSHLVTEAEGASGQGITQSIRIARLAHGGTYDPEPGAITQLEAMMRKDHGIEVLHETIDPATLSDQRLALMTTLGDAELTNEQIDAIRHWLHDGGTLWLDAVGGSREAVANARDLIARLAPDTALRQLRSSSPILSGRGLEGGYDNRRTQFRYFALREMGPVTSPRLQTIEIDERPAIIFSAEDITAGLAGLEHWGIFGYSVPAARRLVANAILHSLAP